MVPGSLDLVVVGVVEMVRLVEVNRVVEIVYRHEENLGVKGPNNKKNKDVGLPMTMPQAAGKKGFSFDLKVVRPKFTPILLRHYSSSS